MELKQIGKRAAPVIGILLAAAMAVGGAYWATAKFLSDRDRLMNRGLMPANYTPDISAASRRQQTKTYTAKELEDLRRKHQLPAGLNQNQPYIPNAATESGQAAVQRALKTLDEINRINAMNQRLLEQQQRAQNQR